MKQSSPGRGAGQSSLSQEVVEFKTQSREGRRAVRGQQGVRIARLSSEDDDQMTSIFDSCVGFS